MAISKYPAELTDTVWKKKKSVTATKTGIGAKLDELEKEYNAIKWKDIQAHGDAKNKDTFDATEEAARTAWSDVEKLATNLYKFRDHAKKVAGEKKMKLPTNKKTKKLIEDMAQKADHLGVGLKSECSDMFKAAKKIVEDYPKTLKAWGERKDNLLAAFKKAEKEFKPLMKLAKKLAADADKAAKAAAKDPSQAKAKIKEAVDAVSDMAPIHKEMKKKNAELFKIFDPHRGSGEKAKEFGITDKDAAPYASVFTDADTLRKELIEQEREVELLVKDAIASVKEAQAATLTGAAKEKAYLKILQDLSKNYGDLGKTMDGAMGAKSILGKGKDYKDSWDMFVTGVTKAPKEDRAKLKPIATQRATQRRDQVNDLEAQLGRIYDHANKAIDKGIKGIPVDARQGKIAEQITKVQDGLQTGKDYYDEWARQNAAAQSTFTAAMKKIANA